MRWNGCRTSLLFIGTVLGIVLSMKTVQAGAAKKNIVDYALSEIKYNNDGGVTKLDNGSDTLTIQMDTLKLKKGYYTSYFYTEVKKQMETGQVISIFVTTKDALAMNINLLDEKGKAFILKDGQTVYLKEENAQEYLLATVENGTFRVPEEFSGEICIPTAFLVTEKEAKKISQLAFVVTQEEGIKTSFVVNGLHVLTKENEESKAFEASYQIVGDQTVTIPAVGEYQYSYEMSKNGIALSKKEYEASLEKEVIGASVSKEGLLTITEEYKGQELALAFKMPSGQRFCYKIQTVESWLAAGEDQESSNAILPNKEEMDSYCNIEENRELTTRIEDIFRVLLVAFTVCYLIFYLKHIKEN